MYLSFYGLSRSVFGTTPQPEYLFKTPSHAEARASLIYGMMEQRGFVAITGEVGVGKTTTLMSALRHMAAEQPDLIIIEFSNPVLSPETLLDILVRRVAYLEPLSIGDLDRLRDHMLTLRKAGRRVVLVFDEAQSIPPETLEFLRILSNLDGEGTPLLVVIFSGQPEFETVMQRSENRALNQRIAIRARVQPLTAAQAKAYLNHYLIAAGGVPEEIMNPAAIRAIIQYAGYVPRRINVLADTALLAGFASGSRPITATEVKAARGSMGGVHLNSSLTNSIGPKIYAAMGLASAVVIFAAIFFSFPSILSFASQMGFDLGAPAISSQAVATPPKPPNPPSKLAEVALKLPGAIQQTAISPPMPKSAPVADEKPIIVPPAKTETPISPPQRGETKAEADIANAIPTVAPVPAPAPPGASSTAVSAPAVSAQAVSASASAVSKRPAPKPQIASIAPPPVAAATGDQLAIEAEPNSAPAAGSTQPPAEARHTLYQLKSGDTIHTVLTKYGLSPTLDTMTLMRKLNPNFATLSKVYPGQFVVVPILNARRSSPSNDHLYQAKPGDTIYSILTRYALPPTPETFTSVRKLNPNFGSLEKIYPGQYIILPVGAHLSEHTP